MIFNPKTVKLEYFSNGSFKREKKTMRYKYNY